jgi:cell division protein FtsN
VPETPAKATQPGAVQPKAGTPPRETRVPNEGPFGHSVSQGEGSLTIQVGSYNERAQAEARAASLKSAGIEAWVARAEIPGKGTWYRVQTGRFTSREEAERYGAQLRAKGAVKDLIITGFQNPQ